MTVYSSNKIGLVSTETKCGKNYSYRPKPDVIRIARTFGVRTRHLLELSSGVSIFNVTSFLGLLYIKFALNYVIVFVMHLLFLYLCIIYMDQNYIHFFY